MHTTTDPLRPSPSHWWAVLALALCASCSGGGGDDVVDPQAGGNGEARTDWDDLVWDEDDWS